MADSGCRIRKLLLKNKVCFVTGSSRGIGAAIAKGFANEGAHVVITYEKNKEKADEIATQIGAKLVLQLDVRNRENIKKCFIKTKEKFGKIDVLVNNAGINRTADFDKQTDEEWDDVIDVNLTGVFRCCQEVLPYISDYGRIINIGSLSGEYGGPRTPSYAAAKRGVIALTHNVARFLGNRNICVNTLSPGVIAGEFTEKTMAPEVKETALRLMIIKRFATYDEMTGAAIFLASEKSSYLTAQTISVNGGAWSH
jgi:NAD(P)-dependent dehydrogenase (short-subunit alcohol dehydrogenase family)